MRSRQIKTLGLVVLMLSSGLIVEGTLTNINNRIFFLTGTRAEVTEITGWLHQLNAWSVTELHQVKWLIIPLAILMFFGWTAAIIRVAFQNRNYQKWALIFHITTVILVAIILIGSHLIGLEESGQRVSRGLLDFILSPLATMILVASFYLDPTKRDRTRSTIDDPGR